MNLNEFKAALSLKKSFCTLTIAGEGNKATTERQRIAEAKTYKFTNGKEAKNIILIRYEGHKNFSPAAMESINIL